MRCIVLAACAMVAMSFPAMAQSEPVTVEQLPRFGGRALFIYKPATGRTDCPTIDASAITPLVAPRLGRTILAEALVYGTNNVGYVFLVSWATEGPFEVYLSSYTQRACALRESQSHQRYFFAGNFNEAKSYYHSLFTELSE
jgi:hypothetical protein